MAKPTLIFTAGAWHTPEVFTSVIIKLRSHGYKCVAIPLQAVGHEPAVQSLLPDIATIHGAVFSEIHEEGNDVVMVAHSWSGTVVGGSLEGLGKVEREKAGEKGGVMRLAYVSAFVPSERVSLIEAFGGTPPDWYDVKEPWVMALTPEKIFFHDLPVSEASYWSSKLKPHSYATKFASASTAAWRTIPSSYLICEDDRAIPVFVQEAMVKACQNAGADMKIERLFASHSPFLSKPDEFVAFVRRAAGEDV